MTDAPAHVAPAPVSRRRVALAALILVLATAAAGWWLWPRPSTPPPPTEAPAPSRVEPVQPPVVTATDPQLQASLQTLSSQVQDLERVNNVLRQQVLALTERSRVIGEQLAAQRLELANAGSASQAGPTPMLALAEQWLELAQGRLELFNDARGALLALDAADRALISSTDPRVLSLRQTLAIEREALRGVPWLDTVSVSGQLEAWQQGLRQWPRLAPATVAGAPSSGWWARLDRYFTVRPLDAGMAVRPEARREELAAELAWARILLVRGERAALQTALQRVEQALAEEFITSDAGVIAARAGLGQLLASLGNERTPQLGNTLLELRSFGGSLIEAPPPAVPAQPAAPAEAPAIEPSEPPANAPDQEVLPESPVEPAGAEPAAGGA